MTIQYDQQWLQAFCSLQQSMISAQKLFTESLLQSHRDFLQVLNTAVNQLSSNPQDVQQTSNLTSPVSLNIDIPAISFPSPITQLTPSHPTQAAATSVVPSQQPIMSVPTQSINIAKPPIENHPLSHTQPVVMPNAITENKPQQVDLKEMMLQVLAEKTAYPIEMLDINMDLQSELGIDSIKRVEILSELQKQVPSLANVDRTKLSTMNTLAEILNYAKSEEADSFLQRPPQQEDNYAKKLVTAG